MQRLTEVDPSPMARAGIGQFSPALPVIIHG
jgi:hypothetical protein